MVVKINADEVVEGAFSEGHGEVVDGFEGAPFSWCFFCPGEGWEWCEEAEAFEAWEGLGMVSFMRDEMTAD